MSSNEKDIKLKKEIRMEKLPNTVKGLSALLLKERLDPNGFVDNTGIGGTGVKELLLCHYLMNGLVFSKGLRDKKDRKDTKDTKKDEEKLQALVDSNLECFELLLMHGADVSKHNPFRQNETLLHRICLRIGSGALNTEYTPKYIDVLLNHKVNVNARDIFGVTPLGILFVGLQNEGFNIVHLEYITQKLLGQGADPRITSNPDAPRDLCNRNAMDFAKEAVNQPSLDEGIRKRIQGLLELMQARAMELNTKKRESAGDAKSSLDIPEGGDEASQDFGIFTVYKTIKAGAAMVTTRITNMFSESGKDKRKP